MAGSNSKTEWHDWVGELFEPAFCATIDDLVAHEPEPDNKPKIKHISVHDPEAIRKVYERVHMMTVLDEQMKEQQKKKSVLAKRKTEEPKQTVSVKPSFSLSTEKTQEKTELDIEDPCIWDSNEISVLRQAYKTLKQQSIEAMVHVRETVKRNKELETLAVQQKKTIDDQKVKLSEARMANKRLQINVSSLNDEVKYLTAKVGAMEDVIREMKLEQADMVKELHDNRVTTDQERMERGRIQMKLDNLKQEALAEKLAAEDKIRTQCKKAIHDLKQEVKRLEKDLIEEKNKRLVTEKGLKHLRNHFSSLAVHDILPQNAVIENQLKNVQY